MYDYDQRSYYDTGCNELRCSLCHFDGPVHFLFHGISDYNSKHINRHYIFIPQHQKINGLEFVGYAGHKLKWDVTNSRWSIVNQHRTVGYLNTSRSELPVGKHTWYTYTSKDTTLGATIDLKLSKVIQNK